MAATAVPSAQTKRDYAALVVAEADGRVSVLRGV